MKVIDRGQGAPLVLVPSLQGRWEYLRPAVDALAASRRVITFSLCDEPSSHSRWNPDAGLNSYADQIADALDNRGVAAAAICGFSFGGRVALRFAAREPARTSALILASTPGPQWHLKSAHRTYAQNPVLLAPLFFAGAPARVRSELQAAFERGSERRRFALAQAATFLRAPLSPSRMAARARLIDGADVMADCARVSAPTLVINGEPGLDHVVPAESTAAFARVIQGAKSVTIERSGHFGLITRPAQFAAEIERFLSDSQASGESTHAA